MIYKALKSQKEPGRTVS